MKKRPLTWFCQRSEASHGLAFFVAAPCAQRGRREPADAGAFHAPGRSGQRHRPGCRVARAGHVNGLWRTKPHDRVRLPHMLSRRGRPEAARRAGTRGKLFCLFRRGTLRAVSGTARMHLPTVRQRARPARKRRRRHAQNRGCHSSIDPRLHFSDFVVYYEYQRWSKTGEVPDETIDRQH